MLIKNIPSPPIRFLIFEGVPPPTISWLYNSRTVSSSGHLDIPRLTEHHSGAYTCLASSPAGKTSLQFYLTVETPHVELPDIKFVSNKTTYQVF